jgi:hypothetical protein
VCLFERSEWEGGSGGCSNGTDELRNRLTLCGEINDAEYAVDGDTGSNEEVDNQGGNGGRRSSSVDCEIKLNEGGSCIEIGVSVARLQSTVNSRDSAPTVAIVAVIC